MLIYAELMEIPYGYTGTKWHLRTATDTERFGNELEEHRDRNYLVVLSALSNDGWEMKHLTKDDDGYMRILLVKQRGWATI